MPRNALISFPKALTDGTAVTVQLENVDTIVLREVILSEFIRHSRFISHISTAPGTGIYQNRDSLVRILDRLDCRPGQTAGRGRMMIGDMKLSTVEVEAIEHALSSIMDTIDKELIKRMKPSGATLHVSIRREAMGRIMKNLKEPVDRTQEVTVDSRRPLEARSFDFHPAGRQQF